MELPIFAAVNEAFNVLDRTIRNESMSGCNVAKLFMTNSTITDGPGEEEVIDLVNHYTDNLATRFNRRTTFFTFG